MLSPYLLLPVLLRGSAVGSAPSPAAQSTNDTAVCRQFFHDACNEAMGRWLPRELAVGYQWLDQHGRHIDHLDHFVYDKARPATLNLSANGGPDDGTYFVYGSAGPPRGHAAYDYVHHIAFYEQGCCSWHDVVAAANAPLPPKRVVARDLHDLRTFRGVHLGMTQAEVTHIYGRTTPLSLKNHPGSTLLAYTSAMKLPGVYSGTCGQWQNFVFRSDRLVWIQLSNAC